MIAAYFTGIYVEEFIAGYEAATVAIPYALPAASGAVVAEGVVGGFVGGFVASGGDLMVAGQGAVSGGLFAWAGTIGSGPTAASSPQRYLAHATAGCVSGAIGGNGCGRGAAAAIVGKWVTNNFTGPDPSVGGFIATMVAGGTASVITGGKFASGAATAAFGYLFNAMGSRGSNPGHHINPVAEIDRLTTSGLLTPEAEQYMRNSTTGRIPDYNDVRNPHRGSHPDINDAAKKINEDFVKDKQITKNNPMTADQAKQLESRLRKDPTISDFLDKIRRYQNMKVFDYARKVFARSPIKAPE